MSLLEDDLLLELLAAARDSHSGSALRSLAETFLDACGTLDDPRAKLPMQLGEEEWRPVMSIVEQTERFCKLVLCLVAPDQHAMNFEEVEYFLKYAGKNSFIKAVKTILTQAAPTDAKKEEQEQRKFIHGLVKDVKRTAASLPQAQPIFKQAVAAVEQKEPQLHDLKFVLEKNSWLKENLRIGQMGSVNQKCAAHLVRMARHIVSEPNAQTDSDSIAFLLQGLKFFNKCEGVAEAENKLGAWAAKHNAAMTKKELLNMFSAYAGAAQQHPQGLAPDTLDVAKAKDALRRCGVASIEKDEDCRDLFQRSACFMMKDAFEKAAGDPGSDVITGCQLYLTFPALPYPPISLRPQAMSAMPCHVIAG